MQLEILKFVPTNHLLGQCRAVSKSWHENASFICRSRQVNLQGSKFYDDPTGLGSRFPNPTSLPWSSMHLSLCSCNKAESIINEELSHMYGYQVQKLHVVVQHHNYGNLMNVLSKMPNLKVLTFKSTGLNNQEFEAGVVEKLLRVYELLGKIRLPKLVTLKTPWMRHDFGKFVEFVITNSGAKLTKLKLMLCGIPSQDLENLLTLPPTAEIKHIAMSLMFSRLANLVNFTTESTRKLLAAQKVINVQKLDVSYFEGNPNISSFELRMMELALSKFKNLVKLTVTGFFSTSQVAELHLLKLPPIGTLEKLKFCCADDENDPLTVQNLFSKVQSIKPCDFPVLKTIHLMETSSGSNYSPKFRRIFASNTTFESVLTLCTCQYNGCDNWAEVFPNLRILIATVRVYEDIQNIFTCQNLESVDITLRTKVDPSLVLSQSFQPRPNCNKLRTLSLRFVQENSLGNTQTTITDSAALLFKSLPPLYLTLVNARITKEMESQLRSRHVVMIK